MDEITVAAHGKVNLSLNITGVEGKMHTLESVVACIDLCDTVRVRFDMSGDIRVRFVGACENIGENNTVTKAVKFLQNKMPDLGADIEVVKNIPLAAGLGGSSADAAAVVRAAASAFEDVFGGSQTVRDSVAIGSDVAALVSGGCSIMGGVGDELRRVNAPRLHLCLACGEGGVSSGEAYKLFDEMYPSRKFCPSCTRSLVSALERGDVETAAKHMHNALSAPACRLCDSVEHTLTALKASEPLAAFVTGSGNACVGLFSNAREAERAAQTLARQNMWTRYAYTV